MVLLTALPKNPGAQVAHAAPVVLNWQGPQLPRVELRQGALKLQPQLTVQLLPEYPRLHAHVLGATHVPLPHPSLHTGMHGLDIVPAIRHKHQSMTDFEPELTGETVAYPALHMQ
jgi:hypothetical protein